MTKKFMMVVAVAALSVGVAGAQRITTDKGDTFNVQSCHFVKDMLQCDMIFTPKQDDTSRHFDPSDFNVTTSSGDNARGETHSAGGSEFTSLYLNPSVFSGAPLKYSVQFKGIPDNARTLAVFSAEGGTVRNIPIGGATAPTPVASPATTINLANGNYLVALTNCQKAANNPAITLCNAALQKR